MTGPEIVLMVMQASLGTRPMELLEGGAVFRVGPSRRRYGVWWCVLKGPIVTLVPLLLSSCHEVSSLLSYTSE